MQWLGKILKNVKEKCAAEHSVKAQDLACNQVYEIEHVSQEKPFSTQYDICNGVWHPE